MKEYYNLMYQFTNKRIDIKYAHSCNKNFSTTTKLFS